MIKTKISKFVNVGTLEEQCRGAIYAEYMHVEIKIGTKGIRRGSILDFVPVCNTCVWI
jgi:hypothetical protein